MAIKLEKEQKFDQKSIKQILTTENKFISDIFSILPISSSHQDTAEIEVEPIKSHFVHKTDKPTSRAQSLTELRDRLKEMQSKNNFSYKDKNLKKGLKNRIKKKSRKEERNLKKKLIRTQQTDTEILTGDGPKEEVKKIKSTKPIFNSEGKMVFSKFDFKEIGTKHKKVINENDPRKLLKKVQKQKEVLKNLEETGDKEKAIEIKEKVAWKNALAKADGQKVKDNPDLLKRSIKKQEQKVKQSKKKWQARTDNVKKLQDERQRKRTENIQKRKKDKKVKNMKKLVKRGKVIPGF